MTNRTHSKLDLGLNLKTIVNSNHIIISITKYLSFQSTINYESMQRYVSPVNPAIFPHLTILLLGIGIFFTAWFFVYEVTSTKLSRDLVKELVIALVAALFSGFGTLFLLLWVGIYVWSALMFCLRYVCLVLSFWLINHQLKVDCGGQRFQ